MGWHDCYSRPLSNRVNGSSQRADFYGRLVERTLEVIPKLVELAPGLENENLQIV